LEQADEVGFVIHNIGLQAEMNYGFARN